MLLLGAAGPRLGPSAASYLLTLGMSLSAATVGSLSAFHNDISNANAGLI